MRLEIILIVTPRDDGTNVFRVTLFVHPVLTEDNVLEHTSAEIPQGESWQVETGIPILTYLQWKLSPWRITKIRRQRKDGPIEAFREAQ